MAVRFETQTEPIAGYRLLERLGSGGFGEVWKAEAPGGIFKAIKIIHGNLNNRETDAYRFAEQELKSLKRVKQVRHPYLLALDRFDIVDGRLMIVMELADCNLWDRFRECRKQGLPGIPRDELVRLMSETAEVLDLMDGQFQLQHLDIKPQNLFLLYGHVKVADFGQVKDLEGVVAPVTGGITPVYAAPETFDGFVSRYCDQYSLACVYQELLTGSRPFDGTSWQQLLMQHLQMPPNLQPAPPCDRPALARALAKRPEDRFPTVSAFVEALRAAGIESTSRVVVPAPPPAPPPRTDPPPARTAEESDQIKVLRTDALLAPLVQVTDPPSTDAPRAEATPPPLVELERLAPPELTGPGSIRPALVVGLGYTGLRVVQRFRKHLSDRYGSARHVPAVRTLYVDTDPDALTAATADYPWAGLSGLTADEVFPARLNRAAYYLNPRTNGRTLLEGWFEPSLLYKLPRTPVSMGLRALGRLAFCDHYRPLMQKVEAELAAALDPHALEDTRATTGLDLRTNRPRVYVVAGLGGGTGSGMFLDLAYSVRSRLRRWGYTDPEVVGLLLLPPDGPTGEVSPLAQANTYAALTELHHYSRPGSVFAAAYDDPAGGIRDAAPPFSQVYLLPGLPHPPGPAGGSGERAPTGSRASGAVRSSGALRNTGLVTQSARTTPIIRGSDSKSGNWGGSRPRSSAEIDLPGRDPSAAVAEFLRLDLLSPVGRSADGARPQPEADQPGTVRMFGLAGFGWPRAEVVGRTARVLAAVLMKQWVSPDPAKLRDVVMPWAAEQWNRLALDPAQLSGRLSAEAGRSVGGKVEDVLDGLTAPLMPVKGWRTRFPEPDKVWHALEQLQRLLGRPCDPINRPPLPLEETLATAATRAATAAHRDLRGLVFGLIEASDFRLAGAEEAVRVVLTQLDKTRTQFDFESAKLEPAAEAAFDHLCGFVNYQKGKPKPAPGEFAEALKGYPANMYKAQVARAVGKAYRHLRDQLLHLLNEIGLCRQRFEKCHQGLKAEAEIPASPAAPTDLLPAGCPTTEDAAQVYLKSLADADLQAVDGRVQAVLEHTCGGLYQASLNSTDGLDEVARIVREECRAYLDARLGEVDLAGMFLQKYGRAAAGAELLKAYEAATPRLVGSGPWGAKGVAVYAGPAGAGGDPIRELAKATLPAGTVTAAVPDEVVIYREYPEVPLAAVPQLGPAWSAAYRSSPEVQQSSPHARLDVTRWADVDAG